MWVLSFRDFNTSQQNTTSAAEGINHSIKLVAKASRCKKAGRDVTWALQLIFDILEPSYSTKHLLKDAGAVINFKKANAIRRSIESAKAVPASSITVIDDAAGSFSVLSSSNVQQRWQVEGTRSNDPSCSCPFGQGGGVCKHAVACMQQQGLTETEIFLLHGSLVGTVGEAAATVVFGGSSSLAPAATSSAGDAAAAVGAVTSQRVSKPLDWWPEVHIAWAAINQVLEGQAGYEPGVRKAAELMRRVAAVLRSDAISRDDTVPDKLRQLTQREDARPGNSLKRHKQLVEVLPQKGRRSRAGAKRVTAEPAGTVEVALVPLRTAKRKEVTRKKSFAEQLASDEPEGGPGAATQWALQNTWLQVAHNAARQPPEAQQEYMALMLTDGSPR